MLKDSVPHAVLQTNASGMAVGQAVSFMCALGFKPTGSAKATCSPGKDDQARAGVWTGLSLECSGVRICRSGPAASSELFAIDEVEGSTVRTALPIVHCACSDRGLLHGASELVARPFHASRSVQSLS